MKRAGVALAFFIVGLITSWAAMLAGSHISRRFHVDGLSHIGGCNEIGPCAVPWWMTALLTAYFLGPSLIFATIGWISVGPSVTYFQRLARLLALVVTTALLYFAGYAISG